MRLNHWEYAQESEESDSLAVFGGEAPVERREMRVKRRGANDFGRHWAFPRSCGSRASELRFVVGRNCGADWAVRLRADRIVKERRGQAGPAT
jgi:hypothetical protein